MKKISSLVFLFVFSILLVGCGNGDANEGDVGNGEDADSQDTNELRLGHVWPSSELHAEAVQEFAEEVDRLSDGQLSIDIYENGSLGDDIELLEGLRIGSTDIWVGGAGVLSSGSNVADIFTVPFMFDNQEHSSTVYDGEIGEDIRNMILEDSDYYILSYWQRGARWLTANRAVEKPDDLQGLSIRVPDSPMFNNSFSRLGASPTPMDFGEVFTSLQQGVIDAQENPLSLIYNSQFNEVQDYLMRTEHVREPITIVMSDETLNSLPEEHQEILQQAANGMAKEYAAEEVAAGEEEYIENLQDAGMELIEPDISEFQNTLDGFVEEEFPHILDIFEDIRASGE